MQMFRLVLIIFCSLFQDLLWASSDWALQRTVNLEQSQLILTEKPEQVQVIHGDWRFTEKLPDPLDAPTFMQLPQLNPLTGEFFFNSYTTLPEQGNFVLAIQASYAMTFTVKLGGLVAQSEFFLLTAEGRRTVYQPPAELDPQDGTGRLQIPHPSFTISVPAGLSYLVYSYQQKSLRKGKVLMTNAGLVGPFQIGSEHEIRQRFQFNEIFLKIPLGVFASLFIYSLLIYYSRHREDKESLVLAAINGLTFLRELLTQTVLLNNIPSSAAWRALHAFGPGLPLLISTLSIHYLQFKVKSRWLAKLRLLSFCNFGLLAINTALMPFETLWPDTSFLTIAAYFINSALFFLFFIPSTLWTSFRKKNSEITNFTIGVLGMAAGTLIDFANSIGDFGWPWMAMWGGMLLSVLLAKNNSRMFAQAFDSAKELNVALRAKNLEVEALNQNLEKTVIKRTAEISALLEHIPQGILSIGAEGKVEANYSAHLPDVLGQTSIAGESFRTLVLDHLELGADDKDQLWQAIIGSIGETVLTFELNCDKFPVELGYVFQGQKKVLKLTWNIECDREQHVQHILVTMLDITQEITTRQELEEKNTDLNIIRQLLDAGARKALQFFASSDELLRENEQLIAGKKLDVETLKILFVNIHTIKGAARTLMFKALSTTLHAAEASYSAFIRDGQAIDYETLMADIRRVRSMFDRYLQVNRDVLGREINFAKVQIDRDFLEQHYALLCNLELRASVPTDLKLIIHQNRDMLTQAIYLSLPTVLEEIFSQAEKIARDLQKAPPAIHLEVDDVLITHRQENVLKNCFLHLLRNALDHGIEIPRERQLSQKPPQGSLFVKAKKVHDQLVIDFWDDGKGLALKKLEERARNLGLLASESGPSDIAETIFHEGISTAASLSQISGRGVGMSAVKRFLEAENGSVDIILPNGLKRIQDYVPIKFRIKLRILPAMPQPREGLAAS